MQGVPSSNIARSALSGAFHARARHRLRPVTTTTMTLRRRRRLKRTTMRVVMVLTTMYLR